MTNHRLGVWHRVEVWAWAKRGPQGRTPQIVRRSHTNSANPWMRGPTNLYHYREIPGTFDAEGRPLYAEEPEDEDDHAMDRVRYVLTGLAHQRRRGSGVRLGDVLRASPPSPDRRPPDAAPGRPTVRRAEF